jgi:outer membrane protein assembly factor BamD (BamD/ComL family)
VAVAPPQAVAPPPGTDPAIALPSDAAPAEYVRRAKQEFDAGRVAAALSIMDQFRRRFPSGTDEAYWLMGQLLEANSPSRNIRSSQDWYRRLIDEFPQSPRVEDARRRIAYLQRYYFNIQ